jgi:cation transport ATPase
MNTPRNLPPAGGPSGTAVQPPFETSPLQLKWHSPAALWQRKSSIVAAPAVLGIGAHLVIRSGIHAEQKTADLPLLTAFVIYPHDIRLVDGIVIEGHGMMDGAYPTGKPFQITKTTGSSVTSGSINGESAITIQTTKLAGDSRYAKIMEVMRESEAKRPALRRLGDKLGAIYTPVALTVAFAGVRWLCSTPFARHSHRG